MMTRRDFAGALSVGALGAAELPALQVIAGGRGEPAPERFSLRGVRFGRAYAACPDGGAWRQTIFTGRFPHMGLSRPVLTEVEAGGVVLYVSEPDGDSPFERSTRVAMALDHPRLAARGMWVDYPVSTVDIAPTVYGLMGLAPPESLHGRNLAPLLLTGRGERPESVYAEGWLGRAGEWRMVVRGLDKIVVQPNLELMHLFNLGEDPHEEHDLAQDSTKQLWVDELRALVREWMKRTGDGMDPSGLRRR
jgi:arylsulfatase A-like enzyme